jgi:hypothetical protein
VGKLFKACALSKSLLNVPIIKLTLFTHKPKCLEACVSAKWECKWPVFFADYSINDSKSTLQIFFNQPATKTLATGQQCVKKCEGKSLNLGRAGKPCQSCSWTGFVYFSQIQNRELILGKGGAKT